MTEWDRKKKVLSIACHRNGVSGDPFFVALVRDSEMKRVFTVIVPAWAPYASPSELSQQAPGGLPCYVIDPGIAAGSASAPGTIAFGENSWRGDHYFDLVAGAAREMYPEG
jgi:hypothetical protein